MHSSSARVLDPRYLVALYPYDMMHQLVGKPLGLRRKSIVAGRKAVRCADDVAEVAAVAALAAGSAVWAGGHDGRSSTAMVEALVL